VGCFALWVGSGVITVGDWVGAVAAPQRRARQPPCQACVGAERGGLVFAVRLACLPGGSPPAAPLSHRRAACAILMSGTPVALPPASHVSALQAGALRQHHHRGGLAAASGQALQGGEGQAAVVMEETGGTRAAAAAPECIGCAQWLRSSDDWPARTAPAGGACAG
jgi:hypothetical protein